MTFTNIIKRVLFIERVWIIKRVFLMLFVTVLFHNGASQTTSNYNSGFDVIVLNNGNIIHGKVVEVGLYLVRYKRTDIPDGPIYEILRDEIYAISYRNQLNEYFIPGDHKIFGEPSPFVPHIEETPYPPEVEPPVWYSGIRYGKIRIGLGGFRNYSLISDTRSYRVEPGFPGLHLGYLFPFMQVLDIGIVLGLANFNYSERVFSEYDQLSTDRTIRESLLTFSAAGKYSLDIDLIRPYVMAGMTYINSNVRSEGTISFLGHEQTVNVRGGSRVSGAGILFRLGAEFTISDNISGYADAGTGLSLVQAGIVLNR